ncbi:L-threonylcarbamoyladenylate synthase [Membranihabitans marinus]|uniref:L-threonylcarbamoyladenylate synthase n=1 Tax=Membranihabitans marinus TaxID=1227546 RepID=UPI001F029D6D|nr:L-threonylcarbamoyladenylate synthase [Membranihabitans marinus]
MNREVLNVVEQLNSGRVILYPTDTIWGLGCDPSDQNAVDKIFAIKKRKHNQPLIILVDDIAMLKTIVPNIHPKLENILFYNTRPLTIIFDHPEINYANGITAENGSIAIRIVQDNFCKDVIKTFGKPIVSTSANISQQPFPQKFEDISPEILQSVDYIVDYKPENNGDILPSSIAKFSISQKELIFLRE